MSSTRKVLRIFLASPGDLQEERRAIRSVVNEFNESWADALGYQIELMGWEGFAQKVDFAQEIGILRKKPIF